LHVAESQTTVLYPASNPTKRPLTAEDARRAVRKPHGQATDGEPVEGFEDEAGGERHAVGKGQRVTNSGGGAGLR